jgi:hypothetical protein
MRGTYHATQVYQISKLCLAGTMPVMFSACDEIQEDLRRCREIRGLIFESKNSAHGYRTKILYLCRLVCCRSIL